MSTKQQNALPGIQYADYYSGKYLSCEEFAPGEVKVGTIDRVELAEVRSDLGMVQKPTVYFTNLPRALVLNKTTATVLCKLSESQNLQDAAGLKVELYTETVNFGNKRTRGIRLRKAEEDGDDEVAF